MEYHQKPVSFGCPQPDVRVTRSLLSERKPEFVLSRHWHWQSLASGRQPEAPILTSSSGSSMGSGAMSRSQSERHWDWRSANATSSLQLEVVHHHHAISDGDQPQPQSHAHAADCLSEDSITAAGPVTELRRPLKIPSPLAPPQAAERPHATDSLPNVGAGLLVVVSSPLGHTSEAEPQPEAVMVAQLDSRRGLPTLVEDCRNDDHHDDDAELLLRPVPPCSASDLNQRGAPSQSCTGRQPQPEGPSVAGGAPRSAESTRDSSRKRHSGGLRPYRHSAREAGILVLEEVKRRLQQLGLTQPEAPAWHQTLLLQRAPACASSRSKKGAPDGGVVTGTTTTSSSTAASASACSSAAAGSASPVVTPTWSNTVSRTRSAAAVLAVVPADSESPEPLPVIASKPYSPTQPETGGGSLPVTTQMPKAHSPWRSPSGSPTCLSQTGSPSQSGRRGGRRGHHHGDHGGGGNNVPSSVMPLAARVARRLGDKANIPSGPPRQWQGSKPQRSEPEPSGSPLRPRAPAPAPTASGTFAVTGTTATVGAKATEAPVVTPGRAERAAPTTPVNHASTLESTEFSFHSPYYPKAPGPRLADASAYPTGRGSCLGDASSRLTRSGSGRKALSPGLVDGLRGVTNQLRSVSDWWHTDGQWHQGIQATSSSGLGSAPGTAVSSPAGASKWWQRQAVGFCEQPEGPVTNPLRGKHRRRRGGQWHSFGGESFGELLPSGWADGEEDTPRTGPVTGRPYSDRMGDSYVMGGVIGRGQSGVVKRCTHKESGKAFACKTVYKEPLVVEGRLDELKREVR